MVAVVESNDSPLSVGMLSVVRQRLGGILVEVELRTPEGAYPNELEMALRLAFNAAQRAERDASAPRPAWVAS